MSNKSRFVRASKKGAKVSPADVTLAGPPSEDSEQVGEVGFVWSQNPEFPGYLRQVREAAGISMRRASKALGTSYAWLARQETGGPVRPPSLEQLQAMAELYRVDTREMLHAAGVRIELPADVDTGPTLSQRFTAVVLDPALRPPLLDEDAAHYIPDRVKRQWLDFAEKLVEQPDPKAFLEELLASAGRRS